MPPDVSVVVPSFARPRQTFRAIRSALRQTDVRPEVVVVDDGSPEPLRLPADLAQASVRVLRLDGNRGPAAARNAGVAAAAAPYIAFLDSDDFFLPDTLAPRVAAVRAAPADPPVLFAAEVWRWQPGRRVDAFRPIGASDIGRLASGCWYFPGSTALLSRRTWERVGPLDDSLRRLEDLDWALRLGLAGGEVRVLPGIAAVVERSGRASPSRVEPAAARLLARFGPDGPRPLDASAFARLAAYLALERASAALGAKRYGAVALELVRSFARHPRAALHLERWWVQRQGTAQELAAVEALARSLEEEPDR
jgi:glycosyltransferase involved in cell wall biosynthesis